MKREPLLILCLVAALSSCSRQIPNKITPAEYSLYSQWTSALFKKNPPELRYVSRRTGVFDPLDSACKSALEKDGASLSLMNEIHALGNAEYLFDVNSNASLQIPWNYKETDAPPDLPPGSFHLVTFSRVAFNRDQTEAFFAFFDACAPGQCGHGGYIEATKRYEDGKWIFRQVGCVIVS